VASLFFKTNRMSKILEQIVISKPIFCPNIIKKNPKQVKTDLLQRFFQFWSVNVFYDLFPKRCCALTRTSVSDRLWLCERSMTILRPWMFQKQLGKVKNVRRSKTLMLCVMIGLKSLQRLHVHASKMKESDIFVCNNLKTSSSK